MWWRRELRRTEQYTLLRQLGCRFGQGFLFSRPVPAETVSEMLRLPGRVLPEPRSCGGRELERLDRDVLKRQRGRMRTRCARRFGNGAERFLIWDGVGASGLELSQGCA